MTVGHSTADQPRSPNLLSQSCPRHCPQCGIPRFLTAWCQQSDFVRQCDNAHKTVDIAHLEPQMLCIVNSRKDSFTSEGRKSPSGAKPFLIGGAPDGQARPVKPLPRAAENAGAAIRPQPVRLSPPPSASTARRCRNCCPAPRPGCRAPRRCSTSPSENKVSLDWLLGLSQDEGLTGEIRASFEIEEGKRRLRPHAARALALRRQRARRSATCRPAFPICCAPTR